MSSMLRWKNKRVSQKQYNKKLLQQRTGLNNRRQKTEDTSGEIPANTCKRIKPLHVNECVQESVREESVEEPRQDSTADLVGDGQVESNGAIYGDRPEEVSAEVMEGRLIVQLALLGAQMWCYLCKEALSLQYITKEVRKGLGSILTIRCHKCLVLNEITTSKSRCDGDQRSKRFDANSKSLLGALHAGLGWTQVDKFLSVLNIPCYNFHTFKKYENEIGLAAEEVAKESCKSTVELERQMTIERAAVIENSL